MSYWKVIALFNEMRDDEEYTISVEKMFDHWQDMRQYVTDCNANGVVGGLVLKYHPSLDIWSYYSEVLF